MRTSIALISGRPQSLKKLQRRDHFIDRIYRHDKAGTDIVILGSNAVTMRNDITFTQGYAQRFELKEVYDGVYHIVLF